MASENLDIGINITGNATKSLNDLQNKVGKLQKGFEDLKTSIATLALDALIGKAVMFADTMQDLATATGVATNSIVGLSKTFEQNGGSAEQARAAILKLTENIGAAAEGGKEAQIAFQKVGISLGDLSKLSEQSILEKTIEGLAKIDDISTRTKVAIDLLGKGAKGVDFSGVASGYKSAAEEAKKYNEAIKASAELNDKIQAAFGKLKLSILKAFEPIANAINAIDDAKLSKFIESFASMAVSLAAVATAIKGLEILGSIFLYIAGTVSLIGAGFASLAKTASAFGTQMRAAGAAIGAGAPIFEALGVTLGIIATKRLPFLVSGLGMLAKGFLGVAGVVLIVNDVIDALTGKGLIGWLGAAYDKTKQFLGLQKEAGGNAGRGDGQAELKARKEEADRIAAQQEEQKNKAREVEAYYKKQADALKATVEQFYRSNEQAAKLLDFEASMVGKTEDQVQMQTALNELTNKYNDEIQKLRDAKKQLGADEGGLRKIYDDQIAALQKNMAADKERLSASITGLQTAKLLEQDRLNTLERITQQFELQKQVAEATSGIHGDVAKQMQDIAFKQSQRGKSPVERQLDEVNKTVNEFQAQAAGKIMSVFETEDGFKNIQQMNAELEKMYAESEKLRAAKIAEMQLSRDWATGWQDAFDSYMDSATNAARIAGEQFNVVMNGMNNAIDKFVETGKFSFGDFARSIIQDLIKIELKAQATKILGAIGGAGGGGFFSMIGGLLGFANGGNPPINKPSVVGENGPELFVPRTAGTVIPNGGSGAGGPTAGMAPINNVTNNYNISAIDSKSVAQFFAENRKTLLGSMQLAQKELPYGNR